MVVHALTLVHRAGHHHGLSRHRVHERGHVRGVGRPLPTCQEERVGPRSREQQHGRCARLDPLGRAGDHDRREYDLPGSHYGAVCARTVGAARGRRGARASVYHPRQSRRGRRARRIHGHARGGRARARAARAPRARVVGDLRVHGQRRPRRLGGVVCVWLGRDPPVGDRTGACPRLCPRPDWRARPRRDRHQPCA